MQAPNAIYNFETWGTQLTDFIQEVLGEPAFILSNSVGGRPQCLSLLSLTNRSCIMSTLQGQQLL